MKEKTVIGLDFGTLSARAVLASCRDGRVLAESEYVYPHGVISGSLPNGRPLPDSFALADAADYRQALISCIRETAKSPELGQLSGICIAATTYTMIPCLADGSALTENGWEDEPHAYVKLWKHHGAIDEAKRIFELHKRTGAFPAVDNYGGVVNCEWALPKLLETYEKAPAVFEKAYRLCDLGEWLTWILTGKPVNSVYSAGFKGMYVPEVGFPSASALDGLAEGFGAAFYGKVAGEVIGYGVPCGAVTREAAELCGIPAGVPVSAPMGDGSAPGICFCAADPDAVAITLGTSIAMAYVSDKLVPMSGINGVVKGGIVPGYYSYDAGQPCGGDMLSWFVHNTLARTDSGAHAALSQTAAGTNPWQNELTVLDWWNGNRGILNDMTLRGSILGLSLATAPEDIYCAMVQGMACGTRRIVDHMSENGLSYPRLIFCGGMAEKNEFVIRQYASIFGRTLLVSSQKHITALSAAILAAHADGVPLDEAVRAMTDGSFTEITPDTEHRQEYETIYRRWCFYHDLLSENRFSENET